MTDLLSQFADPQAIHTMSIADKLLAGLFTTLLGMGITFVALIILQFIISWMDRLINTRKNISLPSPVTQVQAEQSSTPVSVHATPVEAIPPAADNNEIVAAIGAAIGMMLGTSSDQIVIKKLTLVGGKDRSPVWNQIGILEQMQNRL